MAAGKTRHWLRHRPRSSKMHSTLRASGNSLSSRAGGNLVSLTPSRSFTAAHTHCEESSRFALALGREVSDMTSATFRLALDTALSASERGGAFDFGLGTVSAVTGARVGAAAPKFTFGLGAIEAVTTSGRGTARFTFGLGTFAAVGGDSERGGGGSCDEGAPGMNVNAGARASAGVDGVDGATGIRDGRMSAWRAIAGGDASGGDAIVASGGETGASGTGVASGAASGARCTTGDMVGTVSDGAGAAVPPNSSSPALASNAASSACAARSALSVEVACASASASDCS